MSKNPITMADVIDRLFSRLSAVYGTGWTRECAGTPMNDLKTIWGHELAGYINHLAAIAYALDNLPERCPNVIQFKGLCRAAPARELPMLDAPKADPAIVAAVVSRLRGADHAPAGMRDWAHRLKARHEAGDRLNPYQVSSYQQALGLAA